MAWREILEALMGSDHLEPGSIPLAHGGKKGIGHVGANDEHRAGEPGSARVEDRIIHQCRPTGTKSVELFEPAVAAAEAGREHHEGQRGGHRPGANSTAFVSSLAGPSQNPR